MPTKVIDTYDQTEFDQTNVTELQTTLDRLTADVSRWNQTNYCTLTGDDGIDPLTEAHLEAGVYHDFPLSTELVTRIRERSGDVIPRRTMLPVANCGTAFCVAGDVVVRNGWTFIGTPGDEYTSYVVPTTDVPHVLEHGYSDNSRSADSVAREVLNVSYRDAGVLFAPENSLLRVWTIGYGLTGGRLTLPDALPEARSSEASSPALATASAVRNAVMIDLVGYAYNAEEQRFYPLLDLTRLRDLLEMAPRDTFTDLDWQPETIRLAIEDAEKTLTDGDSDD